MQPQPKLIDAVPQRAQGAAAVLPGGQAGGKRVKRQASQRQHDGKAEARRIAAAPGGNHGRQGGGGRARWVDVTDEDSVAATFAGAGDFDTVVNCAGLSNPGALTELELDAWRNTVDICLTGSFLVIKHAGARIAEGGSITCIASLNGRQPGAGMGAYCASKAGVLMLVEVAALELADRRVRVNAVSPGLVMTPLTEGIGFVPGLDGHVCHADTSS